MSFEVDDWGYPGEGYEAPDPSTIEPDGCCNSSFEPSQMPAVLQPKFSPPEQFDLGRFQRVAYIIAQDNQRPSLDSFQRSLAIKALVSFKAGCQANGVGDSADQIAINLGLSRRA